MATATTIKERPILFSAEMVRAILSGAKTQTRRAVKPQPTSESVVGPEWYTPTVVDGYGEEAPGGEVFGIYDADGEWGVKCPYEVGMRLWVRERMEVLSFGANCAHVHYPADGSSSVVPDRKLKRLGVVPSIHMPREASRITLEVTNVRVERLQEITAEDVSDEGFPPDNSPPHDGTRLTAHGRRMVFAETWNQLQLPRAARGQTGLSWGENPWVWAVSFQRLQKER